MQNERIRILAVDDNPADRLQYRMSLKKSPDRNFEIVEAENAESGLEACRTSRPDCILLDFNLPRMDGLEFMSALKTEYGELPCPIVMLTGIQDERVAVRAMKSGVVDYIAKTDKIPGNLERAISGALEKFHMRRQIQEQHAAFIASERQYRTLLEAIPQLVWVADAAGIVEYANGRWWEYTGLAPTERILLRDALHPDDRDRYSEARIRAVEADAPLEIEVRLRRASDRSDRYHLVRVVPMKEQIGHAQRWLGTCTDIEEHRKTERAVQQAQKWESIGLLAGGIAHDFNNLLVGILGGASFVVETLPETHPAQNILDNIVKSGERAAQLTRQMLAYSGQGRLFIEPVNLGAAVAETVQLVRAVIPRNVRVTLQIADSLPLIETDASQMQQVIMNLVINAAEAIAENQPGTVTVRAFTREFVAGSVPEGCSSLRQPAAGTYIVLEVRDEGCGMDEETRSKIFDPFFTTKFTGRGLGLAAVQGIVRSCGGCISVESTLREGSTFRVFLPAATGGSAQAPPEPPGKPAEEKTGAGTILVIDDEEVVRTVARAALEKGGYRVLAAADGATGLAILQDAKNAISLVLLDLGMPGMSGKTILTKIREAGISVPVAICSGYGDAEVSRQLADCDFVAAIHKPFHASELLGQVGTALKSAAACD